jgi:hypothetical protein
MCPLWPEKRLTFSYTELTEVTQRTQRIIGFYLCGSRELCVTNYDLINPVPGKIAGETIWNCETVGLNNRNINDIILVKPHS